MMHRVTILVRVAVLTLWVAHVAPAQDIVLGMADYRNVSFNRAFFDPLPADQPLTGLSVGWAMRYYFLSPEFNAGSPESAFDALIDPLEAGNPNSLLVRPASGGWGWAEPLVAQNSFELFALLLTGYITVGPDSQVPAGTVSFGTRSSDGSVLYLDVNQDGVFSSPEERIVNNKGLQEPTSAIGKVVDLPAGRYRIAIAAYSQTGGLEMEARFLGREETNFDLMNVIHPAHAAQIGNWSYETAGAAMFGGHVELSGPKDDASAETPTSTDYQLVSSRFGMPVYSAQPDFNFGEIITTDFVLLNASPTFRPEWTPQSAAFWEPTTSKLYATDPGLITVSWKNAGGIVVATEEYLIAGRAAPEVVPVALYHTHVNTPISGLPDTDAPQVDVSDVPHTYIKYNTAIPGSNVLRRVNDVLHAKGNQGLVLIEYRSAANAFLGVEVADVRLNLPDGPRRRVHIGERLLPGVVDAAMDKPQVLKGLGVLDPDKRFVYQHENPLSSQHGHVFAVKTTDQAEHAEDVEIYWMKKGLQDVLWPYELRRYTADWPSINEPTTYQRYVLGSVDAGPKVIIPGTLNATLEPFQDPANHANLAVPHFSAALPEGEPGGWSLLRYAQGNGVAFQVVRSTPHNDLSVFDLSPTAWDIGSEITDAAHQGTFPGFVYRQEGDRYAEQTITGDPIYGPPDPAHGWSDGQIFPVNTGTLEIWWANLSHGVQWPSMVSRYAATWPTNSPLVVIANQEGTGPIDTGVYPAFQLYYQNDSNAPGFNPNDEHAIRANSNAGQGEALYALRSDLGTPATSDPHLLMSYQTPDAPPAWRFKVWDVVAQRAPNELLRYGPQTLGLGASLVQPPTPIKLGGPLMPTPTPVSGPYFIDRKTNLHARAAGDNGGTAEIVVQYHYKTAPEFYFPSDPPPAGSQVPWLDRYAGTPGTPVSVTNIVQWPTNAAVLNVGESLVDTKKDLPGIRGQTSVEVLYQQTEKTDPGTSSIKLIDPFHRRTAELDVLPSDIKVINDAGNLFFAELPPHLRDRVWYDSVAQKLVMKGAYVDQNVNEPYLLLNVLDDREAQRVSDLSPDGPFQFAVAELGALGILEDPAATNREDYAISAGLATGTGWVTIAVGNSAPPTPDDNTVDLHYFEVGCPLYQGAVNTILSGDPFDEKLTLRHSGDFAGAPEDYVFQWRTKPPNALGQAPISIPPEQWDPWIVDEAEGSGALDTTIEGPGPFTLSDNFFICRWRPKTQPPCSASTDPNDWFSPWTPPGFAPGWIKRVLDGLNPFDQKFTDYRENEVDTITSMIAQAGPRSEGAVPLNQEAAKDLGLIEIYETVLKRGMGLSIDAGFTDAGANAALLQVAGRLADLYMLLGNEAFADALDPSVGFGTDDGDHGFEAGSLFCFMNQATSLLDEELKLLRGLDGLQNDVTHAPEYNRLFWNFSSDIVGGEVAYFTNYEIEEKDGEPGIDANDAKVLYPQAHGDAWGHYLTAIKHYYRLLRNGHYVWVPRAEPILVAGAPKTVDFLDERKFANAAAARARVGQQLVNLTYRQEYTEDPEGQWQGYRDDNPDRAWGLDGWARRAGQGTFLDWVVGNAILPDVSTNSGIQQVDRNTVSGLREVASAFGEIQKEVDGADNGLNPLGLAKNMVPMDIDPAALEAGQSHFEQVFDRAMRTVRNAEVLFDHAQTTSARMRRQSDSSDDFGDMVEEREADLNNRLIEIFGTPYPEDSDYDTTENVPDLLHFGYVDRFALSGAAEPDAVDLVVDRSESTVNSDGGLSTTTSPVTFHMAETRFALVKPDHFTVRRSPGEIQRTLSHLIQTRLHFENALRTYNNHVTTIEDRAELIQTQHSVNGKEIRLLKGKSNTVTRLNEEIRSFRIAQLAATRAGQLLGDVAAAAAESIPTGLTDAGSGGRGALRLTGALGAAAEGVLADISGVAELDAQSERDVALFGTDIELTTNNQSLALKHELTVLQELVRRESDLNVELFILQGSMQQATDDYLAAMSRGFRILDDRDRFRKQTAADVQEFRYKDMAFRIFRDDALQKYRAQFDLAARYCFVAAKAYDFEVNLDSSRILFNDIVRARSIGKLTQLGEPRIGGVGDPGLSDAMARMRANFDILEGSLGINNPHSDVTRFSLKEELFRIKGNQQWQEILARHRVEDLRSVPEYQRYCHPFHNPQNPDPEPAIVIPFATMNDAGNGFNFFGLPATGGDSVYPPTRFATKIRSVGVWFSDYNNTSLLETPNVYLIPVGNDVFRSPDSLHRLREWKVLDQVLPLPFELGAAPSQLDWRPIDPTSMVGSNNDFIKLRRFGEFRAFHDAGFNLGQTFNSNRLVGRSVWNTRWMLIIPGRLLLPSDPDEGIREFIYGDGSPFSTTVSDILLYFQTYSYGS